MRFVPRLWPSTARDTSTLLLKLLITHHHSMQRRCARIVCVCLLLGSVQRHKVLPSSASCIKCQRLTRPLIPSFQTVSVMEGRHACWFDDGRLQPIDDTVLSEEDGASTTARGRSGTIAPPSYNDVIRADHEGRAPAGSFRGAWTHAGHASPMAGAGHYQPPVGAYSHHTIVEPVAGCVASFCSACC